MYCVRLSERRWLGDRGIAISRNEADPKQYKTIKGAKKALMSAIDNCSAWDSAFYGVYTIDYSLVHCPAVKVLDL